MMQHTATSAHKKRAEQQNDRMKVAKGHNCGQQSRVEKGSQQAPNGGCSPQKLSGIIPLVARIKRAMKYDATHGHFCS
jgi:hypothetical protein